MSILQKKLPGFSKTLFLDITIPNNLLISKNISKFYKWKAKTTFKTQQWILTHTEVDIYVNVWTKFPLNNRQPSKAVQNLTVSHQNYKKNNRQQLKLPPHRHPLKQGSEIEYVLS